MRPLLRLMLATVLSVTAVSPVAAQSADIRQPAAQGSETGPALPKNIILLIGDGFGAGQLTAMKMLIGGIALDAFPVGGMVLTQSASDFVTESASAGTALSTGDRTASRVLSRRPDGTPLFRLLSRAQRAGKATGVIATSSLTHATPAAFLTDAGDRGKEFYIAEGIANSGADVLIGGGRRFFSPDGSGGARSDGRDLLGEMRDRGYAVFTDSTAQSPARGRLLWLLAPEGLPAAQDRQYAQRAHVETALRLLSEDADGFVLMIEGSQIDWAAHDNDFTALKAELRDFDGSISAALEFARADGQTLVVVTADHETGGLALTGHAPEGADMQAHWISGDHTGNMVPLFAFGPAAERFGGIHRNDEIGRLLHQLLDSVRASSH